MKKYLFVFLMALMSLAAYAESEPYAVLSDDGLTVTFYYDSQKASRSGVVEIQSEYCLNSYRTAAEAFFDASFADYSPTSTAYWFYECSNLTSISNMNNLNTANVTDMTSMFCGCSGLTSLDVSGFNTEEVTSMRSEERRVGKECRSRWSPYH